MSLRNRAARTATWSRLRGKNSFSPDDLPLDAGLDLGASLQYLETLRQAGYVEPLKPMRDKVRRRYRLVRDTGPHAPVPRGRRLLDPNLQPETTDVQTRIWQAMRILKVFEAPQLQAAAAAPADSTVRRLMARLLRSGYLQELPPAGDTLWTQYRLIRDTGPQCPVLLGRSGPVFDPNSLELYP